MHKVKTIKIKNGEMVFRVYQCTMDIPIRGGYCGMVSVSP